jgi:hypothetical protein
LVSVEVLRNSMSAGQRKVFNDMLEADKQHFINSIELNALNRGIIDKLFKEKYFSEEHLSNELIRYAEVRGWNKSSILF